MRSPAKDSMIRFTQIIDYSWPYSQAYFSALCSQILSSRFASYLLLFFLWAFFLLKYYFTEDTYGTKLSDPYEKRSNSWRAAIYFKFPVHRANRDAKDPFHRIAAGN